MALEVVQSIKALVLTGPTKPTDPATDPATHRATDRGEMPEPKMPTQNFDLKRATPDTMDLAGLSSKAIDAIKWGVESHYKDKLVNLVAYENPPLAQDKLNELRKKPLQEVQVEVSRMGKQESVEQIMFEKNLGCLSQGEMLKVLNDVNKQNSFIDKDKQILMDRGYI